MKQGLSGLFNLVDSLHRYQVLEALEIDPSGRPPVLAPERREGDEDG